MAGVIGGYISPAGGGGGSILAGSVVSGSIASGSLSNTLFASGTLIDSARWLQDDFYTTAEAISGTRCVGFTQSGYLQVAMAGVSGRMPAIGVCTTNYASGAAALLITQGRAMSAQFNVSGNFFSGFLNQLCYVGTSGEFVSISGIPFASGNIQQAIGMIVSNSGLFVRPL